MNSNEIESFPTGWASEEFREANLGDQRLTSGLASGLIERREPGFCNQTDIFVQRRRNFWVV